MITVIRVVDKEYRTERRCNRVTPTNAQNTSEFAQRRHSTQQPPMNKQMIKRSWENSLPRQTTARPREKERANGRDSGLQTVRNTIDSRHIPFRLVSAHGWTHKRERVRKSLPSRLPSPPPPRSAPLPGTSVRGPARAWRCPALGSTRVSVLQASRARSRACLQRADLPTFGERIREIFVSGSRPIRGRQRTLRRCRSSPARRLDVMWGMCAANCCDSPPLINTFLDHSAGAAADAIFTRRQPRSLAPYSVPAGEFRARFGLAISVITHLFAKIVPHGDADMACTSSSCRAFPSGDGTIPER
ncbi:hypothetical protein MPTK1_6g19220 [Marchantia polymorpha subsp. ruderalis]|uniref:Uncharacterized protein n=2 Tax=Marchantia polymorpha TaxID=3197 RepID=A0AAF6BTQ6_MARPO|nr:hypothetical protein MARPO_0045s0141 [Marchantia polymorpha]BBN15390.1 hypothetical protein Mp_6g19220 [Marchantia polymorpha subsp. ruderalis]|eukprot:PTQ39498.1 hypothetical protein MARPO_0045s0141 [Marchantia polymorpha]